MRRGSVCNAVYDAVSNAALEQLAPLGIWKVRMGWAVR